MYNTLFDLWEHADSIPDLGGGGRMIGPRLAELASHVGGGKCIVDIGPFLGSTTAYLALGTQALGYQAPIFSYDLWDIKFRFSKKVWKHCKIAVRVGEDLQERWFENVKIFGASIVGIKGNAYKADPPPYPIGLLVDDCTSGFDKLRRVFARFGPRLAPGATIVMMDYGFAETKTHPHFAETVEYFEDRIEIFGEPIPIGPKRSTAVKFIYQGGLE